MASIRCEELITGLARGAYSGAVEIPSIASIGTGNTTRTPLAAPGEVVFGPAREEIDVLVRSFGGDVYVTKGRSPPVATSANAFLVRDGQFVQLHLLAGESIAAITATIA